MRSIVVHCVSDFKLKINIMFAGLFRIGIFSSLSDSLRRKTAIKSYPFVVGGSIRSLNKSPKNRGMNLASEDGTNSP
jgi:hypothetical protein